MHGQSRRRLVNAGLPGLIVVEILRPISWLHMFVCVAIFGLLVWFLASTYRSETCEPNWDAIPANCVDSELSDADH